MLLAIDTSTQQIGLACYTEQGLLAECIWDSGRNHTMQLMPQLDLLLAHLGRGPEALVALALAIGPGSWSGLRVGLSIAKGFALAHSMPVIGVNILDALVYQFAGLGLPVVPLIRLGRERFASLERQLQAPYSVTLAELAADIREPVLFCGDIDGAVRTQLHELLGERAHFPALAASARRPGYLAELGWQRFQRADFDDAVTLEPIYLGQPVRIV